MKIVTKRKIDELGRIVLPIELRRYFNLSKDDIVDIRATEYDIIISKATEGSSSKKTVDVLGRIYIPHEMREKFDMKPKSLIAILPFEDGIHLALTDEPYETLESTQEKTSANADVFEKDYTASKRRYRSLTKGFGDDSELFNRIRKAGLFEEYHRNNTQIPRIINPAGKEAYENALAFCDRWALLKGGKIRGEVNYDEYIARIKVTFSFIEFFGDNLQLMQYIAHTADYVLFETNTYGEVTMYMRFNYFEKLDRSATPILDALYAHPELTGELLAHRQEEIKAILNDPTLSKSIAEGAAIAGVTPEEYLDRLEDAIEEDPVQFIKLLYPEEHKDEK